MPSTSPARRRGLRRLYGAHRIERVTRQQQIPRLLAVIAGVRDQRPDIIEQRSDRYRRGAASAW